jgi:hypothetical protein
MLQEIEGSGYVVYVLQGMTWAKVHDGSGYVVRMNCKGSIVAHISGIVAMAPWEENMSGAKKWECSTGAKGEDITYSGGGIVNVKTREMAERHATKI